MINTSPIHLFLGDFQLVSEWVLLIFDLTTVEWFYYLLSTIFTTHMVNRTIHCPPKFDELNFPIWKIKMTIFLQFQGTHVANAITKPFICHEDDEDTWSKITVKEYDGHSKAHYALSQGLNDDISRVINCTSANHIWHTLITTHEGTTQVKKAKIDLLSSQYDNFYMLGIVCVCPYLCWTKRASYSTSTLI